MSGRQMLSALGNFGGILFGIDVKVIPYVFAPQERVKLVCLRICEARALIFTGDYYLIIQVILLHDSHIE